MRILRAAERRYFTPPNSDERLCILIGRLPHQGSSLSHTIAVVELAPSASSDPHFHEERDESYLVLSGSGHAFIDGNAVALSAGDLLSAPRGEHHQFKADRETGLSYLVVTAPAWVPDDSHK